MKLTLQTQLLPDPEDAPKIMATVERFNEAATWLAEIAFERKIANKFELQKLCYAELRERFGLSAQMAIRCIAQVCEAYKRDKGKRPKYRKHSAMPFDQRMISFKGPDRVSLLTLEGRVIVPFIMGKYQVERFGFARGQCDLVLRKDGKWFLLVTVDVPEGTKLPVTDFLGVDLGIVNIACDSDGNVYTGEAVEKIRRKHQASRKTRQQKGTKGTKKQLKKLDSFSPSEEVHPCPPIHSIPCGSNRSSGDSSGGAVGWERCCTSRSARATTMPRAGNWRTIATP